MQEMVLENEYGLKIVENLLPKSSPRVSHMNFLFLRFVSMSGILISLNVLYVTSRFGSCEA